MPTPHARLSRYAHPIGPPPVPSEADRAEAERFLRDVYDADDDYKARNWERLLGQAAKAVMQSRMGREHRERGGDRRERDAA